MKQMHMVYITNDEGKSGYSLINIKKIFLRSFKKILLRNKLLAARKI